MAHTIVLRLQESGKELRVWDEFRLTHDLFSPGSAWTFGLWYSRETGSTWKEIRETVKLGARVQVLIDGALQLDGLVATVEPHAGRDGAGLAISGRDLAASVIDSEVDPRTKVRGMTVEDAIAQILSQFPGLQFVVGCEAEAAREVAALQRPGPRGTSTRRRRRRRHPLDRYRIRPGQKGWDVLSDIATHAGCLLWTGPTDKGTGVILDTPKLTGDPLYFFERRDVGNGTFAGNILSSRHRFNITGIPTALTANSHSGGGGDLSSTTRVLYNTAVTESSLCVPGLEFWNQRYLDVRRMRSSADATRVVERTIAQANRDFVQYSVTVKGFWQNGKLYAVNQLARLRDDLEWPVIDKDLLVVRVSFSSSRKGGQTTEVTLLPPAAVQVFPVEE